MAELGFAQNDEDLILARFFGTQKSGFFVDAGAFDGITYSNTYLLERRGWDGLCIEPNPQSHARCTTNRTATCIQTALVSDPTMKTVTLRIPPMAILTTLADDHDADIQTIHRNVGELFTGWHEESVPAMTLDKVLAYFVDNRPIDLLTIDCEWRNADVLAGCDLKRWQPRVLVVETGAGVRDMLTDYYVVLEHGSNYFCVRDAQDIERMSDAY